MPDQNIRFYNTAAAGVFSNTVGGTATYNGPATATGTGVITDNVAGVQGQYLTDDHSGATATGTVTVGGNTSTGVDIDNELGWTLRDTVTGETFQVAELDVEGGAAGGSYLLSEIPLVPGRIYETLDYNTLPDATTTGGTSFSYADHAESAFSSDGTVNGSGGDDVMGLGYADAGSDTITTGDDIIIGGGGDDAIDASGGNDTIIGDQTALNDGNDSISGGAGDDTIFGDSVGDASGVAETTILSWERQGVADNANVAGGFVGVTVNGVVSITLTVTQEANFTSATVSNDTLYDFDGRDDNSSLRFEGGAAGTSQDAMTIRLDFDAVKMGYADEVSNVSFGIFDLDAFDNAFIDQVIITAYDAAGNVVPNVITLGGGTTQTTVTNADGSTTTAAILNSNGDGNTNDVTGYIRVDVAGPVAYIEVDYNNVEGANAGHAIRIGDIELTTIPDASAPDDGGDDFIDGGTGDDRLMGDAGDDTLAGGTGDDSVTGGTGDDLVDAGDAIIAGHSTHDDLIDAGAGDDTINSGAGDDTVFCGSGDDTIVINDGFGSHQITGDEAGETDGDTIDASGLTQAVDVTFGGPETGTVASTTDTVTSNTIENVATGAGDDTVTGAAGSQTVATGAGNDTVTTTGTGADTIDAGAGDDSITFSEGDSISGGTGDDTFTYENLGEPTNGTITIVAGQGGETPDDGNPDTHEGDTLNLGYAAKMSTLDITATTVNADGNTSYTGPVEMDDGTLLEFPEIENIVCFIPRCAYPDRLGSTRYRNAQGR